MRMATRYALTDVQTFLSLLNKIRIPTALTFNRLVRLTTGQALTTMTPSYVTCSLKSVSAQWNRRHVSFHSTASTRASRATTKTWKDTCSIARTLMRVIPTPCATKVPFVIVNMSAKLTKMRQQLKNMPRRGQRSMSHMTDTWSQLPTATKLSTPSVERRMYARITFSTKATLWLLNCFITILWCAAHVKTLTPSCAMSLLTTTRKTFLSAFSHLALSLKKWHPSISATPATKRHTIRQCSPVLLRMTVLGLRCISLLEMIRIRPKKSGLRN